MSLDVEAIRDRLAKGYVVRAVANTLGGATIDVAFFDALADVRALLAEVERLTGERDRAREVAAALEAENAKLREALRQGVERCEAWVVASGLGSRCNLDSLAKCDRCRTALALLAGDPR